MSHSMMYVRNWIITFYYALIWNVHTNWNIQIQMSHSTIFSCIILAKLSNIWCEMVLILCQTLLLFLMEAIFLIPSLLIKVINTYSFYIHEFSISKSKIMDFEKNTKTRDTKWVLSSNWGYNILHFKIHKTIQLMDFVVGSSDIKNL